MKKLLLVALAVVGLASCVQNEELVVAGSKTAIAFSDAYVYNATKADPTTTTATIEDFDVWAFMDSVSGTVFTDEDVTKSNGAWGYTNTQYWYPGHTYYFAALSPANSANVTEKTLATGQDAELGLGEIAFTNVDGTEDLLYAKAKVTTPDAATLANQGMEPVKMQFQHLLSKVKFTFQNGFASDLTTVKVTGVKMTAPKAGTIDLAQADYAAAWELSTTEADFELAFGDVASTLTTTARSAAAAHDRLTIPANATKEYTVTFNVEVFQGGVSALSTPITATISGVALQMGKAYNFTAVINQDVLDLKPIQFTAEVDEWASPVVDKTIGYFVDNNGNYVVASSEGLQDIAAGINEGTINADVDIILNGNIDLSASRSLVSNWTPIGSAEKPFTGTFDGKGFTISNLQLVSEASDFYVGFFGYAKNATIKDVVFNNVYVKVGGEDTNEGGHIAAVVGALEGTSTIEKVTVQGNVYVEADVTMNNASRVAAVVGGNGYGNVTVKDVHVQASEGSYVKANNCVGALAGQLNGVVSFENCTANIDVTGTKFFAGGIIGLTATESTFVNCHSTGDIAITAGRSGKAHDHYRVGGIAGGWDDNITYPCVLTNCSYTGKLSGANSDGSVAETFDYLGYVGRGYSINGRNGSKVVIDGTEFVQTAAGVYTINGASYVSEGLYYAADTKTYVVVNAEGLISLASTAIKGGEIITLAKDIDLAGKTFNGLSAFNPEANNTFDGQGHSVLNWTNESGKSDLGFITNWVGTVKNLTIENANLKTAGRSAIVAAKIYGNIENCHVVNSSIVDSYWACGAIAGLYNSGNIIGCTVTGSLVKSNGGVGGIVGVINETSGKRCINNCAVINTTVHNTGIYGEGYSAALVCGMLNISNSTVEIKGCTLENNTKEGKYVGDLYYNANGNTIVVE